MGLISPHRCDVLHFPLHSPHSGKLSYAPILCHAFPSMPLLLHTEHPVLSMCHPPSATSGAKLSLSYMMSNKCSLIWHSRWLLHSSVPSLGFICVSFTKLPSIAITCSNVLFSLPACKLPEDRVCFQVLSESCTAPYTQYMNEWVSKWINEYHTHFFPH